MAQGSFDCVGLRSANANSAQDDTLYLISTSPYDDTSFDLEQPLIGKPSRWGGSLRQR